MTDPAELAALARAIVDGNKYMVLATTDESGRPWATPVYYAPEAYNEFFWLSWPGTRHSRNVAARPEVSIVIFDSRVRIGGAQAVYMAAEVDRPDGADLQRGIEIFSRVSQSHGARPWTLDDVSEPARLRLYRATASEHWILDPDAEVDERIAVSPGY
jgi:uncharacterized protein YhbP (UPF0306 family)